ncbi:MAG TPA: Hsp70 family protein [Myxococcales bacterium]|nr:Hsp70 family protein [Myxococcales bacterium]
MSPSPESVLGIDLGTTFCTAALLSDGRLHYVLDGRGDACIPSVVHFPRRGPPLIGADADRMRASDPANTIWGIKRLIGKAAEAASARILDASAAFTIRAPPGGGEAEIVARDVRYRASEVASLLLRYLREQAQARFGRRIGKAIVTVPVTATAEVKKAMIDCGKMAGLEITRIVAEPVAGALAHAGPGLKDGVPLLVFDFGGGTFDATVVLRQGTLIRVLSADGDDCLGGHDFDLAFARSIADAVWRSRKVDVTHDLVLWDRIQRQSEQVKRALSFAESARFHVPEAFSAESGPTDLDAQLRREQVEGHWTELVERSIEACSRALQQAGARPDQLGAVLLIGGTSYIPLVRRRVAQSFQRPYLVEEEPQTAVARGAALLAARGASLLAA